MKCKCGGKTKLSRIKVTIRDKNYRVSSFKCNNCNKELEAIKIQRPKRK